MTWDATLAMIVNGQRRRRLKLPVCRLWLQCFRPDDARAVEIAGRWIVSPVEPITVANAMPSA